MKLRIYFQAAWRDSSSSCPWALCNDLGAITQAGDSLLTAMPKADEYIAIIAASNLSCVSVKVPARSKRRWEAALPFVAEEFTLTDPDENHVVPGDPQKDGKRSLFIVDKQWLQKIVAACQQANITLRRAIPETLLTNLPADTWEVIWDGTRGFMRTGLSSGMALDESDENHPPLTLMLSLNAAQAAPPKNIQLRFCKNVEPEQAVLPQWPELTTKLTLGDPWDWRSETIPNNTLNLLWGALAPKARMAEWLPKFRPLAFILLAALFIETIGSNIEWALLKHEKTKLMHDMELTFRQAFGDSSVVVNPSLQMQRNIAALRHDLGVPDEADFLLLLDQASGALSSLPSGSISALHYESGRLDIDIKLRKDAELHALQQRLQANGLSVRIGDIRHAENGVETRMAIQTGGVL